MVTCVTAHNDGRCEKHEQRHDLSWMNDPTTTNAERRRVACHELGHTVGLTHNPPRHGCMPDLIDQSDSDRWSEHDVDHINGGAWRLDWDSDEMPFILNEGEFMSSWNGRFKLKMQPDGNWVLYDGGTAVWADNRMNNGFNYIMMQADGNVVHYADFGSGAQALCSTRTHGFWGADFRVQDDGNLVVRKPDGTAVWTRFGGGVCS